MHPPVRDAVSPIHVFVFRSWSGSSEWRKDAALNQLSIIQMCCVAVGRWTLAHKRPWCLPAMWVVSGGTWQLSHRCVCFGSDVVSAPLQTHTHKVNERRKRCWLMRSPNWLGLRVFVWAVRQLLCMCVCVGEGCAQLDVTLCLFLYRITAGDQVLLEA